jgi:hypothetical protein
VIELARSRGYTVEEVAVSVQEAMQADEVRLGGLFGREMEGGGLGWRAGWRGNGGGLGREMKRRQSRCQQMPADASQPAVHGR